MQARTLQTIRDLQRTQERKSKSNDVYTYFETALAPFTKVGLRKEALAFVEAQKAIGYVIRPPDRIARRQRTALVCWFCEHHPGSLEHRFTTDLAAYRMHSGGPPAPAPELVPSAQLPKLGDVVVDDFLVSDDGIFCDLEVDEW
jgi:hypothetical protein